MGTIVKLAKDVADKIAAGEVVERPLSVVKELLENSLDAGAASVVVEIRNGGKNYIRVTDNGTGIDPDDLSLVFERHATSKIREAKDLESIGTLGFRGEALSSISAVSRIELITKTRVSKAASRVLAEAGEILSVEETGAQDGTTIIVSDLFYNTPARRKFLKPDGTEASLVIDLVSRMALCYPDTKIRLVSNGKILFSTNGKGDRYQNILTVYGKDLAENLLYSRAERNGLSLEAYLSGPEMTKSSRRNQYFFVNGRTVNSKILEDAIKDGYREKMFEGRYPVVFLFLTADPASLDVNIHPAKREIKFEDEGKIRAFVADSVRNALYTRYAVPEIRYRDGVRTEIRDIGSDNGTVTHLSSGPGENNTDRKAETTRTASVPAFSGDSLSEALSDVKKSAVNRPDTDRFRFSGISKIEKGNQSELDVKKLLSSISSSENSRPEWIPEATSERAGSAGKDEVSYTGSPSGEGSTYDFVSHEDRTPDLREEKDSYSVFLKEDGKPDPLSAEPFHSVSSGMTQDQSGNGSVRNGDRPDAEQHRREKPFEPRALTITGSIFATYITASDDTYFYLIDQHAAHERVFYERLLSAEKRAEKACQILLQPFVFEVSPAVKARELDWVPVLESLCYVIEEFGPRSYAVKEIPAFMDMEEARSFMDEFADRLEEERDVTDPVKRNRIITMSCKSAVKANDQLDILEMKQLLEDLSLCENPFSCPHGRPVFLKLSRGEIERLFKRK